MGKVGQTTSTEWQGLSEATAQLKLWRLQSHNRRTEETCSKALVRSRRIASSAECAAPAPSALEPCK